MTTITFNGYELTENYICSELERGFMPRSIDAIKVSGRDGEIFTGETLSPVEINVTLTTIGNAPFRSEQLRVLAEILNTTEPKPLAISDDGGLYYMAIANVTDLLTRYIGAEQANISFIAHDPRMYGETKTVTVPSGGEVTFEVGGNTYTHPSFTAQAVRNALSELWGLRLDNSDYIQVATKNSNAVKVDCDCAARTLKVAGVTALPTLTSDWFVFTPATHTLKNDVGSGATTVTYTERWL